MIKFLFILIVIVVTDAKKDKMKKSRNVSTDSECGICFDMIKGAVKHESK